jgi:predicted N-acetyltransferase YhbS
MKAAANSKRLNENASIAAKNAVTRAKNEAKIKQQQEAAIMNMSHSEREAYKKIMKEQRITSTVKKANDDEAITIGHILMIVVSIVAVLGALFFGAVAMGVLHR